ncbi:hypothetical protein O6H91_04G136800 [Diphasiastrum complanatum]|uniref:Uncharacterized protein n=5 Tax=Diphasiastrum complanatum TaxID=34168 RepID=A0ACC2E2T7_DIPCM|nr:hypothetical protein O6H91_04G136800 [Diphasiastrum complanatum]KAJ7560597.1 hypothetical protein O6H91_04G136800 [Diphasiastrum complanatum]KAJ7560598.1 hypothetical protein O6H91_04G136800 [Diphasiastrum complanatum]KAJ7560599.1 hypothetical protein O6H91_04G136800 [Diphasiastrum complanatum]KAJ7560600.1 hypothetical protein O6H91_04G136800 [Diphasiastrum complanatum]
MEQLKTIGRELALSSQVGWGSSKEFLDLVKAIGEAKSKAEEERIIIADIELLRKKIGEPDVPRRKMKEYIIRLVYVEMLGHDASFGYIHAVKMTHDDSLLLKRTGYLATTLFLNEDHSLIILIINTIQKDLRSDNYLVCCAALTAVCRLINEETIPAVLPQIVDLLSHQKEAVRKKAVMALDRFYQRSPSLVSHLIPEIRQKLCDRDPSVMSAALCALFDMITAESEPFKNLTGSLVSILKQVVEHRLPKLYDYHRTPAPFIQIKLLKILALLGSGDKHTSENMYNVLGQILTKGDPSTNIGNAILYECVSTLSAIYPNQKLLQHAAELTAKFLKSENHNSKYMGIDALGRLIKINPECAEDHQLAVIDCLEDPDDTLKRKTLDLLYKMTKSSNVDVIVDRMIGYMRTISDAHYKTDISSRIIELAERYAPSNHWFIQTMNQVFEFAGDLVPAKVAHDLMRLIAEGAGGEDEDADNQLRSSAVESYLQVLGEPKLPSVLLQVICWVLGEYGTADGSHSADYIIGKLCDVAEAHPGDNTVKGYAITAITKICAFEKGAGRKVGLTSECRSLIEELSTSHSTNLQQRAYELQALLGLNDETVATVMPMDASCEDIEVDKSLAFLNAFVKSALEKGARPYLSESERLSIGGITTLASSNNQNDLSHSLRFEAYERPQLPVPSLSSFQPTVVREFEDQRTTNNNLRATYAGHSTSMTDTQLVNTEAASLRLDGIQKKWGRPTYNNTPASSTSSADRGRSAAGNSPAEFSKDEPVESSLKSAVESRYVTSRKQRPEISEEKQKLAASLFGGTFPKSQSSSRSSGSTGKVSKSSHSRSQAPHIGANEQSAQMRSANSSTSIDKGHEKSLPVSQNLATPDLLDLGDGDSAGPSSDPFKQLEGLLEVPSTAMPSKPVIPQQVPDLLSLYESTPSSGSPSINLIG